VEQQVDRFWVSQEQVNLVVDGGLLPDRSSQYPEFLTLESLQDEHVLVLLGDPGSGKSTEIVRLADRELDRIGMGNLLLLSPSPREGWLAVRSEDSLMRYWFESQKYQLWKKSDDPLLVLVDGLDEIRRDVPHAAYLIANELSLLNDGQHSRIYFRVTCRTNEWDDSIGAAKTYILAPPLESDLVRHADQRGVDGSKLIAELRDTTLWPFSARPITWDWLIDESRHASLRSKSADDIFWRGMQKICTEEDPSRQVVEPDLLRAIAARIGYLSLLSGKTVVWTGTDLSEIPDNSLSVSEILGGSESARSGDITVDRASVSETIKSGIFLSHGNRSIGFAHQSYQEFLAARYCANRKILSDQILSAIRNPQDSTGKVLDRYWQFAGWLAVADDTFFETLCQLDPEALVQSDAVPLTSEAKDALLKSYLASVESGRIVRTGWYDRRKLRKFAHESSGKLSASYIENKSHSQETRQTAIYVVEACASDEVAPILAQIALDRTEPEPLRRSAAHVVSLLENDDAKLLIKPLIHSGTVESSDELRGYALESNWPDRIEAGELFASITPSGSAIWGSYKRFLQNMIESLRFEDIPLAINWIERQAEVDWGDFRYDLDGIHEDIVAKAWDGISILEARRALVTHIARRIESGNSIFGYRESLLATSSERDWSREIVDDADRRRLFLGCLIPEIATKEANRRIGLLRIAGLLRLEDVDWHEKRLLENSDSELDEILAKLVIATTDIKDLNRLWRLRDHKRFGGYFKAQFEAIGLDSEEADRQRLIYRVFEAPPGPDPELDSRVEEWNTKTAALLQKIEEGEDLAWSSVDYALQDHPAEIGPQNPPLHTDIRDFGGWKMLQQSSRDLLIQSAQRFLSHWTPDLSNIGTDTYILGNLSGVRALTLLALEAPQDLESLEPSVWQKWGPAILSFPPRNNSEITPNLDTLLKLAIENGYDPITDLDLLTRNEASSTGYYFQHALKLYGESVDPESLTKTLAELLRQEFDPNVHQTVVEIAIAAGSEYPTSCVIQAIADWLEEEGDSKLVGRLLARLLQRSPDVWDRFWPQVLENPEIRASVICEFSWNDQESARLLYSLSEQQLSELYATLAGLYPPNEDPNIVGVHTVSPRERVGQWREQVLGKLEARGTWKAVSEIESLRLQFPEIYWLPRVLERARKLARTTTYEPPTPKELMVLADESDARLINSNDALLNAVINSLHRLERHLHAESPAVVELWNHPYVSGKSTPKDEIYLSDYIKRWLDRDLRERRVLVNREVSNRRGDETDVYIQAIGPIPEDVFTVVVEVKGCWNEELPWAMNEQLYDRYLVGQGHSHGIYLVGYFDRDSWDADDFQTRHRTPRNHTIDDLRLGLEHEASNLSNDQVDVTAFVLDARLNPAERSS
jgi:hypothetical protein